MQHRKTDGRDGTVPEYPRSSRFTETPDGWFFMTREGVSVGPYETLFDAELSASLLVARLSQLDEGRGAAAMIQGFLCDAANPLIRPARRHVSRRGWDRGTSRRASSGRVGVAAIQRAWAALRLKPAA